MRVLLAPDKFKGCLTAAQVAAAVAAGLHDQRPDLDIVQVPVADGGDGTVAAALGSGYRPVEVLTVGPTGLPVRTEYALQGPRAVIELADVVGLTRLPAGCQAPLVASTFGLGVVVRDALDRGATEIVLGLGGSASTDGGAGLVQALGGSLVDAAGRELPPGGAALASLRGLDVTALQTRIHGVRFVVACDVDNPLLGPSGAAAVFGPQKGATLVGADLVVTGEGSLDEQSLAGKAPVGVAQRAARAGVRVVAVAGRSLLGDAQLRRAGIWAAYPLAKLEPDLSRSMAHAPELLRRVGSTIADDWLVG